MGGGVDFGEAIGKAITGFETGMRLRDLYDNIQERRRANAQADELRQRSRVEWDQAQEDRRRYLEAEQRVNAMLSRPLPALPTDRLPTEEEMQARLAATPTIGEIYPGIAIQGPTGTVPSAGQVRHEAAQTRRDEALAERDATGRGRQYPGLTQEQIQALEGSTGLQASRLRFVGVDANGSPLFSPGQLLTPSERAVQEHRQRLRDNADERAQEAATLGRLRFFLNIDADDRHLAAPLVSNDPSFAPYREEGGNINLGTLQSDSNLRHGLLYLEDPDALADMQSYLTRTGRSSDPNYAFIFGKPTELSDVDQSVVARNVYNEMYLNERLLKDLSADEKTVYQRLRTDFHGGRGIEDVNDVLAVFDANTVRTVGVERILAIAAAMRWADSNYTDQRSEKKFRDWQQQHDYRRANPMPRAAQGLQSGAVDNLNRLVVGEITEEKMTNDVRISVLAVNRDVKNFLDGVAALPAGAEQNFWATFMLQHKDLWSDMQGVRLVDELSITSDDYHRAKRIYDQLAQLFPGMTTIGEPMDAPTTTRPVYGGPATGERSSAPAAPGLPPVYEEPAGGKPPRTAGVTDAPPASAAAAPEQRTGVVATNQSQLRIRQRPGTDAPIVGLADKGSTLTIIRDAGNGWLEVEQNGRRGFVSSQYVRESGAAPAGGGTAGTAVTPAAVNYQTLQRLRRQQASP